MKHINYSGTIDTLFENAAQEGVLKLNEEDLVYFSETLSDAEMNGRVSFEIVEGGFQYRLVA